MNPSLDIFVCTDHDGHWPVGVCSLIIAPSEFEARALLLLELHQHGLDTDKPFTLRKISNREPKAFVLLDGNY